METGVEAFPAQFVELDNLDFDVEAAVAGDAVEAVFFFMLDPLFGYLGVGVFIFFEDVVEEVFAAAGDVALQDVGVFGLEVGRAIFLDVLDEVLFALKGEAAEHVSQTVGVAGDEVDRPIFEGNIGGFLIYVGPPLAGGAAVVGQGTGQEAEGEGLLVLGDGEEVGGRVVFPDAAQAVEVVEVDAGVVAENH